MDGNNRPSPSEQSIDPIWTSSRTARQIYALGDVDKDISRLLAIAASCISLLTLPQTDESGNSLPQGDERSEQFVLEVSDPLMTILQQVHINIRSTLAQIRQSRIAPSAINAPPPNFIPHSSGVGMPAMDDATTENRSRGLQEERVNRDAWKGILEALTRLKAARDRESEGTQMETG
ncbi:hypothetical protein BD410DRAFT_782106 [Rickenella mellea]|uniref:Uncharacterized protein n=1 Tax=Rickenella mellea TaxID=50990 RepID=A0A4Y7QLL7_9AGAM|nr:hypothetical protein BD410DRAFT_782106 [Rickenella mellea]